MLGHEHRIIISSTVTRRGEGSNPKRAAALTRYRLRVRRRRIVTSAVLFLDSVPAGAPSPRRPSANVRPILRSLLCGLPPLNLVNASKMLPRLSVMETRRRDGPPAREYDEIPYDRRERCLFNPFVQRDGIVLRGGCLTIPALGHTNMFSSTKRGRVELNGERLGAFRSDLSCETRNASSRCLRRSRDAP